MRQSFLSRPIEQPVTSLVSIFLLWKGLLFLLAVCTPGLGYDTSTSLLTNHVTPLSYLASKFTRWDAIYFTEAARRGYVFEQEWAFGWGFTRLIAAVVKGKPLSFHPVASMLNP
jgi:phosphatidylinositol glycan class V